MAGFGLIVRAPVGWEPIDRSVEIADSSVEIAEKKTCQILVKAFKMIRSNFIRIYQKHDFVSSVPELHRAVIAGCVEF